VGEVIGALRPVAPDVGIPPVPTMAAILIVAVVGLVVRRINDAGVGIGAGVISVGRDMWAGLVFVVIGSVAVAGPVLVRPLVAPPRLLVTDTAIRGQGTSGL
jgi:hypothetical protein